MGKQISAVSALKGHFNAESGEIRRDRRANLNWALLRISQGCQRVVLLL